MILYLLRRLGFLVLTLVLTSILIFVITQWLPGDVARVLLGREAGEAALEALRAELGLNDPLPVQYLRWVRNLAVGDWGRSFSTASDVRPLVAERLRNSLWLSLVTLLMSVPLALVLGVLAGLREDSLLDNAISILALAVVGLPEFVTGLVLIQILAFGLRLLPAISIVTPEESFLEVLPRLLLPALTATLVLLAYVARLTRAGVVEEAVEGAGYEIDREAVSGGGPEAMLVEDRAEDAQVAEEVRSHFGTEVLRTNIPRSVRISEAPSYGQTVLTYQPQSVGAVCYVRAAEEIARRDNAQKEIR